LAAESAALIDKARAMVEAQRVPPAGARLLGAAAKEDQTSDVPAEKPGETVDDE
jgi:2-keto-3-deoxy-L-rhamnonate aldolase RhmA